MVCFVSRWLGNSGGNTWLKEVVGWEIKNVGQLRGADTESEPATPEQSNTPQNTEDLEEKDETTER